MRLILLASTVLLSTAPAFAQRGGHGGGGGGGHSGGGGFGGGHSSGGGGGFSRPSTPSYSRPSTPSYSRPSTPSYSRPSTPSYSRPSTPSYSGGGGNHISTPSTSRPSLGHNGTFNGGAVNNGGAVHNGGTIRNGGTVNNGTIHNGGTFGTNRGTFANNGNRGSFNHSGNINIHNNRTTVVRNRTVVRNVNVSIGGGRSFSRSVGYRGYYYHGVGLYGYRPAYYYQPRFYGYCSVRLGNPWIYGWGWGGLPWYGYYGYYFQPWTTYYYPSYWMTDYIIAEMMANRYNELQAQQQQIDANNELIQQQQMIIDESTKLQLAAQVDQSLQARQNQSTLTLDQKLQDPKHVFAINQTIQATPVGTSGTCNLNQGDLIRLKGSPPAPSEAFAIMNVITSQVGSCKPGVDILVSLKSLQDSENNFEASVDDAAEQMAKDPKLSKDLPEQPTTIKVPLASEEVPDDMYPNSN